MVKLRKEDSNPIANNRKETIDLNKIKMLFLTTMLLLICSVPALAADINVAVNGKLVSFPDQKPYIDSANRTMVPVRFPAETLGATVDWLEDTRQVHITNKAHDALKDADIMATIGRKDVVVNGSTKYMDTVAVITNSRTMVPVRFISEYLGAVVTWDSGNSVAHVFSKGQSEAEQKAIMEQIAQELKGQQPIQPAPTTQTGQQGSKYNQLSAEKVAELKALPYLSTPETPLGGEMVTEKYDATYKGLLDKMELKAGQSFYSSRELMYVDGLHDYTVRGVLQTTNPDGSITEKDVTATAFYGGSSMQKEWGWHPVYFFDVRTGKAIQ